MSFGSPTKDQSAPLAPGAFPPSPNFSAAKSEPRASPAASPAASFIPEVNMENVRLNHCTLILICLFCPPLAIWVKDQQLTKMVLACTALWLCFGVPGFFFAIWYVYCKADDEEAQIPLPIPRKLKVLKWLLEKHDKRAAAAGAPAGSPPAAPSPTAQSTAPSAPPPAAF